MGSFMIAVVILIIVFGVFFSMRSTSVSGQLDKMYRYLETKGYDTKKLNSLNSINIESIQYFAGIKGYDKVTGVRLFIYDHKSLILFPPLKHEAAGLEEVEHKKFMELPLHTIHQIEVCSGDEAVKNQLLPQGLASEIMVGDNAAFMMFVHYDKRFKGEGRGKEAERNKEADEAEGTGSIEKGNVVEKKNGADTAEKENDAEKTGVVEKSDGVATDNDAEKSVLILRIGLSRESVDIIRQSIEEELR